MKVIGCFILWKTPHWFQKNDACVMTNLASVMWHNFRESCKKCAILREHDSEHNLSLITAAAPFIAYINNWSHNNSSLCEQLLITSVLDHKRGPVIRHSVRWLGASANMYLSILWIMSFEWFIIVKWWMKKNRDGDRSTAWRHWELQCETYFNW